MSDAIIPFELDGSGFPLNPRLGTLFIKDHHLYARVRLGILPTWYPIASPSQYHLHSQGDAASRWVVTHNMGMSVLNLWAQAQDPQGNLLMGHLTQVSTDVFFIDFAAAQSGSVVVVSPGALAVPTIVASQLTIGQVVITETGVTIAGSPVVTLSDLGSGVNFVTITQMDARIQQVVGAAPSALDTLEEIAARMLSNESTAVALVGTVGLKANRSELAAVAFSGSYVDLLNKPVFPTALSQFTNDQAFITGPTAPVQTVFGRQGVITMTEQDVVAALGFTPYNATNPEGYVTSATASVHSVFGRSGDVVLTSPDVVAALGYTPYSDANPSGYQTSMQMDARIQQVVGAAPSALDTLEELASRLIGEESGLGALTLTVASKANILHDHPISEVQGLLSFLNTKADTASLKTVAFTNNYTDLLNKPSSYVLPLATSTAIGGVKQGSGILISGDGTISTTGVYGVSSVGGKTGDVLLTTSDVQGLATVASTGSYSALSDRPTIPTKVSQLENDLAYITSASPLVQSVAGRTGIVSLTVDDVANAVSMDTLGIPSGVATLDVDGRLTSAQIPESLVGGMTYVGTWDAQTNTPMLASGSGTKGQYYKVSVAGSTDLGQANVWTLGDLVIYNGLTWDQVQGSAPDVQSVCGRVGTIVLTSADISTALGYTPYPATNPYGFVGVGFESVKSVFGRLGDVVLTSPDVVTALGFTPYSAANPSDYQTLSQVGSAITAAAYVLPEASATVLGGVKVDALTITSINGVLSGLALGSTNPAALSTASTPGVALFAAHADHVHPFPTAAQVGAISGNQMITISGDVSGSGNTAITLTLPNVATAGTYGSPTQVPGVTVNAKGLVTSVTLNTITPSGIGAIPSTALGTNSGVATLDSSGKLTSAQIPSALVGALQYQGVWDASANIPTLSTSAGPKGHYYKVGVAGFYPLMGTVDWSVGDLLISNGSTWDQIQGGSSDVSSVFGRLGAITLTSSDVTTALGYTPYNATNPSGFLTASGTIANATNATNATYISGTQQTSVILGVASSMSMSQDSGTTRGSFIARATGAGDANLAGMTFWNDAYAIKMGVREDGYFGLGGWSRAAWSWYSDTSGNMVSAGNVTAYSDPRLKENFKTLTDPHWLLSRLDGGTFTWKSGIPHTECKAGRKDYGILADQVEAVMPEIVTESIEIDGESYKTVDYTKLIPVLLEAIKDLNRRVIALGG